MTASLLKTQTSRRRRSGDVSEVLEDSYGISLISPPACFHHPACATIRSTYRQLFRPSHRIISDTRHPYRKQNVTAGISALQSPERSRFSPPGTLGFRALIAEQADMQPAARPAPANPTSYCCWLVCG